jgi:hypothetical protein
LVGGSELPRQVAKTIAAGAEQFLVCQFVFLVCQFVKAPAWADGNAPHRWLSWTAAADDGHPGIEARRRR